MIEPATPEAGGLSLVAVFAIVTATALIVIFYGGPAPSTSPGANLLFQGTYTYAPVSLTVDGSGASESNYVTAIPNVSVGQDLFTVQFADSPGFADVYGFVTDAEGLTFAFSVGAAGPLNISDRSSTWGSADGNAEVAWISLSGERATVELGSRQSQWTVATEPFPPVDPCYTTTPPTAAFGGAYWSVSGSGCFSPGGENTEWNVTLPSGQVDGWGIGGPEISACQFPSAPHVEFPPSTECFAWFDPEARLGMAISNTGVLMLAMS